MLNEMNNKIDNLTRIVQLVVNEQVPSLTLPNDINLPIDSLDELNQLEENLNTDKELKEKLVSVLFHFKS